MILLFSKRLKMVHDFSKEIKSTMYSFESTAQVKQKYEMYFVAKDAASYQNTFVYVLYI